MEHIYLVQFDWSTTDADGIETELYEHYNDCLLYTSDAADE